MEWVFYMKMDIYLGSMIDALRTDASRDLCSRGPDQTPIETEPHSLSHPYPQEKMSIK
jgi:hypothetical protein